MAEIHINVGIVALARGFLSLEEFAAGISSLVERSTMSIRDLWVRPGRLDEKQLATGLDAIGPTNGRDTMLFNAEPPKAADPDKDSGRRDTARRPASSCSFPWAAWRPPPQRRR